MRVLAVENFAGTALGQVGAALRDKDARIETLKPYQGDALPPDAGGYDALVVLGGGQNALDDEHYPYFPALMDLARDFTERQRAVLGICLGAQLLARAFGGSNLIGAVREFAWRPVMLTEDGLADPVLRQAGPSFPIFHWHEDTFALPAAAVHLARSGVTPNQAFRVGRATYGVQFHFEADRELVGEWNRTFADFLAERQPDWPTRHAKEAARHGPAADVAGRAIATAWVGAI